MPINVLFLFIITTAPTELRSSLKRKDDKRVHPDKTSEQSPSVMKVGKDVNQQNPGEGQIGEKPKATDGRKRHHSHHSRKNPSQNTIPETPNKEKIPNQVGDDVVIPVHRRRHKRKRGVKVYRVRDGKNFYKFRKIGAPGEEQVPMEDPLNFDNIKKAVNFQDWKRGAHMTLPSNIGTSLALCE